MKNKDERLHMRIPSWLKAAADGAAKRNGIKLSNFVEESIKEKLEKGIDEFNKSGQCARTNRGN